MACRYYATSSARQSFSNKTKPKAAKRPDLEFARPDPNLARALNLTTHALIRISHPEPNHTHVPARTHHTSLQLANRKSLDQKENLMIKEAIQKVSQKEDLPYEEAEAVMDEIMSGQATPV